MTIETAHPSLLVQCETRRDELRAALSRLDALGPSKTSQHIQGALDALADLLTAPGEPTPIVAAQLSKWLATHKHLGAKEAREAAAQTATPVAVPAPAVAATDPPRGPS